MKIAKNSLLSALLALVMVCSLAAPLTAQAAPKTYTVSANLFCPGELNTQLPGVTAYLTNGNNPLGQDGYAPEPPVTPMSSNATLTVAPDGTATVTVPIKNPVFTLQSIGGCSNAKIISAPRDSRVYTALDGSGSRTGRITSLTVELLDHSGTYVFTSCKEYPTLLSTEWTVPLTLAVDMSGVDFGTGEAPAQKPNTPSSKPQTANTDSLRAVIGTVDKAIAGAIVSKDGSDVEPSKTWVTKAAVDSLRTQLGKAKAALAAVDQGTVNQAEKQLKQALETFRKSEQSGKQQSAGDAVGNPGTTLKAGTYTVTCNVWFNKADTGLPLNPHITNPTFPPYNPVLDNAQLVVDNEGSGKVTVPVTIQDKIISVYALEGLNIVDSQKREDGAYTSFTVDLGKVPTDSTVINKTCTATIQMGELAMSISGLEKDHTWPASFSLNLSGLPCANGSKMPVVEVEMMDAQAASDAMAAVNPDGVPDMEEAEEAEEEEVPEEKTGSTGLVVGVVIAAAAVIGGAVVVMKKRKH